MMAILFSKARVNSRLFLGLCALEVGLLTVVVSGYRMNYKPDLSSFFASPPGWMFLLAILGCCFASVLVTRQRDAVDKASRRVTLALNVLCVVCAVSAAEAIPRWLAIRDLGGEHIGRLLLRPRGWHAVVQRYNMMLDELESKPTFFVGDSLLGWTVGKDRRSADGLMQSNGEGIRVGTVGERAPNAPAECRVAIVGDSFALADGVPFDETWGAYLEKALARRCRVMNFAVSGYSIGQMYLRFKRDVLAHHPDVVIMAFTDGALSRTMGIYGFLVMTDWECPWAQPRFVMDNQKLSAVNLPLPEPREIFSARSIRDVPSISYDRWFLPSEWEQRYWGPAYMSYAFRWITSLYPLYEANRPDISDESLLEVNAGLIESFRALAASNGITSIVLYLPKRDDYGPRKIPLLTHGLMKNLSVSFVDATPCVEAVAPDARFVVTNYHYSASGNQAVATCVLPEVQAAAAKKAVQPRERGGAIHG